MTRGPKRGSSQPSGRQLSVRVRKAKGRPNSSTRWLQRQLNDPYVAEAKRQGYRSRAAFKLIDLDDKLGFLKPGAQVVDLGAAPGGWCQVAVARCGDKGRVVGLDLLEMEPIAGATLLQLDFLEDSAPAQLKASLDGAADVVLTDMAAPTVGHPQTDHLRIMGLAEAALAFAQEILSPGGTFVAKVFQGGSERAFLDQLKRDFEKVRHVKPPSSRKESSELYVVATNFRGS